MLRAFISGFLFLLISVYSTTAFSNEVEAVIKDWPKAVQESIFLKLWDPEFPSDVDRDDPSRFTRLPSPGYELSGQIVHTTTTEWNGQTIYVVIYLVSGRDQGFYEYYFLDEEGELLRSSRKNADSISRHSFSKTPPITSQR